MKGRDILVAFDGSESALKAVEYVGSQFSGLKDINVTLFYVIPNIPPQFWDDGHILTPAERQERQVVIDRWFANQNMVLEPLFEKARRVLAEKGLGREQVDTRMAGDEISVADAILEEARTGRYTTLVLGRQGGVPVLAGGLATTILHRGAGLAICIVE